MEIINRIRNIHVVIKNKIIIFDSFHCPTCGSTNVKRISAASKVAGAYAFGLFSKTAKVSLSVGIVGISASYFSIAIS